VRLPATIDADGLLDLRLPETAREWLKKRSGQRVEVELRDEAAIRSNRQNRYWFGCVIPFVADQWHR